MQYWLAPFIGGQQLALDPGRHLCIEVMEMVGIEVDIEGFPVSVNLVEQHQVGVVIGNADIELMAFVFEGQRIIGLLVDAFDEGIQVFRLDDELNQYDEYSFLLF